MGRKIAHLCEECGADCEALYSAPSRKAFDATLYWVCDDCFKDIEGVSREEYTITYKED